MTRRLLVVLLALAAVSLGLATPAAWAWWTDSASGTGKVTAATLQPPTGLTCSGGVIRWTAPSGAPAGLQYKVTYVGSGGVLGIGVPPSGSATTTGTSWSPPGSLLTVAGTETVSVQSQFDNWLSVSTGTTKLTITLSLLGAGSVSCG
jgi:predicted ribosomally synthesized peptide with SipW-like signal peptide